MLRRISTEGHRVVTPETARTAIHGLRALNAILRIATPQTDADIDLQKRIRVALDELGAGK